LLGDREEYVALSHRYRFLMKGFELSLHLRVVDVGVDHRRGQVRMAEHLLDQADLACLPVEIRCERMPQRVGRNILVNLRLRRVALHHPLYVTVTQRLAV